MLTGDDLPPSYSQLFPQRSPRGRKSPSGSIRLSPIAEEESPPPYPHGARSFGPVEYPANEMVSCFVIAYMFVQAITKFGMSFVHLGTNCRGCQAQTCGFCRIQVAINLINAFNFWQAGYMKFAQEKTLQRRYDYCGGYGHRGFYFFLIDNFSLCLMIEGSLHSPRRVPALAIPCIVLIVCNFLVLWLVRNFESHSYEPLLDSDSYLFYKKSEKHQHQRSFTIRESTAFRIVIENCNRGDWKKEWPLCVERSVISLYTGSAGETKEHHKAVHFYVPLVKDLKQGKLLTLVPETHSGQGVYSISGFRSFGAARADKIVTTVYDRHSICIVQMIEEFKRQDCRVNLIGAAELGIQRSRGVGYVL